MELRICNGGQSYPVRVVAFNSAEGWSRRRSKADMLARFCAANVRLWPKADIGSRPSEDGGRQTSLRAQSDWQLRGQQRYIVWHSEHQKNLVSRMRYGDFSVLFLTLEQ